MPFVMLDKCAVIGLSFDEIRRLGKVHSLVVPISLLREMLSTTAKKGATDKKLDKVLIQSAEKLLQTNVHLPPPAEQLAKWELLGVKSVPMDGRPPHTYHGMPIRGRGGSDGIFYGLPYGMKWLKDFAAGKINEAYRHKAKEMYDYDNRMRILAQNNSIFIKFIKNMPKFTHFYELAIWLREILYQSDNQEYHIRMMAAGLISKRETDELLIRWKREGKPNYCKRFPYALYFYWVRFSFTTGIAQGLITLTEKNKLHEDYLYLHYLPFCNFFVTSDKELRKHVAIFSRVGRHGQGLISVEKLKSTIKECRKPNEKNFSEQRKASKVSDTNNIGSESTNKVSPSTNSFARRLVLPDKKLTGSLQDRSINFLDGVLEIAGYSVEAGWDKVRRNFSTDTVRKIYSFHENLWNDGDSIECLVADLVSENIFRCLYLGELEDFDVKSQVIKWCLYVDQILIPDPFSFCWLSDKDIMPMKKPEIYEMWTLKLVYSLLMIRSLVADGQVLFVPNPLDFDRTAEENFSEAINLYANPSAELPVDRDRSDVMFKLNLIRLFAGLPENERPQAFKEACLGEESALFTKLARRACESDLFYLDRRSFSEPMAYLFKNSISFEEALLLSAFYRAVPLPATYATLKHQFLKQSDRDDSTVLVNKYLEKLNTVNFGDSSNILALKSSGFSKSFIKIFSAIVNGNHKIGEDELKSMINEHKNYVEAISSINSSHLVKKERVALVHSPTGFATERAKRAIKSYDPSLLCQLPNYMLDVPINKAPRLL